jgi:hypothetical protein
MDSVESFINPYWYRGIGVREMVSPNSLTNKNLEVKVEDDPMRQKAIENMNELWRILNNLFEAMVDCDAPKEWREEMHNAFHYWTIIQVYLRTGKIEGDC